MKKIFFIAIIALVCPNVANAQVQLNNFYEKEKTSTFYDEETPKRIQLSKDIDKPLFLDIAGYVKSEGFYDTRQTLDFGDGQFLQFPKNKLCDPSGKDINNQSQFNMAAIESRFNFTFSGPQVFCADAYATVEWDFWGGGFPVIRRSRMRHAYVRLDWEDVSFLTGQYWHPIFVEECYPDTISFNTGAPIEPYARNPQVRITPQFGDVKFIFAAITQLNSISAGPEGFSSVYMRNAHLPHLHAQIQLKANTHYLGAGIDFKRLVPRLVSSKGFKVEESIKSIAVFGYVALNFENFHVRAKTSYVENGTEFDQLGGYAVHCIDPVTDGREYTNLRAASFWVDVTIKNGCMEPGIFAGYTKNLGARRTVVQTDPADSDVSLLYALDPRVDEVWRITPRMRWHLKPVVFGMELEYTSASYGTIDNRARVRDAHPVGNIRFLASALYHF